MNIQAEKEQLINSIQFIEDVELIKKLQEEINQWLATDALIQSVAKPMREMVTVEDLIEEQNYQGFNKNRFDEIVDELDIQEPIEDLLEMLN